MLKINVDAFVISLSLLAAALLGCNRSPTPTGEARDPELARSLTSVCDDVAAHITAVAYVKMTGDLTESAGSENCVLSGQAPAAQRVGDPMEDLRTRLEASGYEEARQYAADGPGTSAFGFARDGVTCVISGGVPASLEDGEIVSDTVFSVNAVCAPRVTSVTNPY